MLNEKWILRQTGSAFAYYETRVPESELLQSCLDAVEESIGRYYPLEDPKQQQDVVRDKVQRLIQLREEG